MRYKALRQVNYKQTTSFTYYINLMYSNTILDTFIPLPWQGIIPEWCDCNYRNAWTVKEYCSLFIGTRHSLWGITIMPLIKVYNNDSNTCGLKGHSTFKSVCNSEASWTATFGITCSQLQPKLFLPVGPSATKHGPNSVYLCWFSCGYCVSLRLFSSHLAILC